MSRTKGINSDVRAENDDYPTPQKLCDAIVSRLHDGYLTRTGAPPVVLEPSAGRGNFVRSVRLHWPNADVTAVEINTKYRTDLIAAEASEVHDTSLEYAVPHALSLCKYDLIVGNPPFRSAEEHIRLLCPLLAPGGRLVFLLRINFLGAYKRVGFWKEYPPNELWPIAPRPSFSVDGGSDGTEYGVFVWDKWTGSAQDIGSDGCSIEHLVGHEKGWK